MDLLRFLLLLPVRLVRGLFHLLGLILRPLFGNLSWSAPAWAPATGAAIGREPARLTAMPVRCPLRLLAALPAALARCSGPLRYARRTPRRAEVALPP